MVLLSKFWNLSKNIEKTIHAKNRFQVHRYRKTFNFGAPILKWEFSKTFNLNGNTYTINKAFTMKQTQFQNTSIKATHLTKKYTQTHHSLKKYNPIITTKNRTRMNQKNKRTSFLLAIVAGHLSYRSVFGRECLFFYGIINFFQVFFGANQSFVLL